MKARLAVLAIIGFWVLSLAVAFAQVQAPQAGPAGMPLWMAETVCKASQDATKRGDKGFWDRAARELELDNPRRAELLIFCLGYSLGQRSLVRK